MIYEKIKKDGTENEVTRVDESDAFDYALQCVQNNDEDRKEFVEWFFSGNWMEVEEDEDERS